MDTWIDPATGDYTGARISRLENAVYLRLMTPLGYGRARAVEVSAEQPHDGRCLLHVTVTDATGQRYSYEHFVPVGA